VELLKLGGAAVEGEVGRSSTEFVELLKHVGVDTLRRTGPLYYVRKKIMALKKITRSSAQVKWKVERSDERWERRADMLMVKFSQVSTLLPSQITHQKAQRKHNK
jgi:hypothetical protein